MEIKGIEHIGIAVRELDESIRYYEDVLGLHCYAVEDIPEQMVRTAFFRVGDTKIELLESTGPDGPVRRFIDKKGPGLHHIAFSVDDVTSALEEAEDKGIRLIDREPGKGAEQLDTGFLHPSSTLGVLTEFCSKGD